MGITVEGVSISDCQMDSVSEQMRFLDVFTYSEVQKAFAVAGVDRQTTYRAADRWLQIQKKAGKIAYKSKAWRWIP